MTKADWGDAWGGEITGRCPLCLEPVQVAVERFVPAKTLKTTTMSRVTRIPYLPLPHHDHHGVQQTKQAGILVDASASLLCGRSW